MSPPSHVQEAARRLVRMSLLGLLGLLCAVALPLPLLGLGRARADAVSIQPARLRVELLAGQLIIDDANSGERQAVLRLSGEPRAFALVGRVLYVARRERGVALFDLRDPRAPREVATFANELLVASLRVFDDVLQLRTPSGGTIAAYRLRAGESPTLLMRLQAWDDDSEPTSPDSDNATGAKSGQAPPAGLRLRLRDGSWVTGLLLPAGSPEYVVLRLPSRATLTLLNSEIEQREPAPVPASQAPGDPPPELPRALRAAPPDGAARQEVRAGGSATGPTVVGARRYRVDGVNFQIYRVDGIRREPLGETKLPWAGQHPPLVYGRAAYVLLPYRGLAVVDIGLSRFPYVIWHLLPHQAVKSARLEGQYLRVSTDQGQTVYNVADPLRPDGPERFRAIPPRHYPDDQDRLQVIDETWQDQGNLWPVSGRRIHLTDDSTLEGHWTGSRVEGVTLEILGQSRLIPHNEIRHSEPVDLDSLPPLPGTAPAKPTSAPRATATVGRAFLVGGSVILAVVQAAVVIGLVTAFVTLPLWVPLPLYATPPRSGIVLDPPLASTQSYPPASTITVLRVRF